MRPFAPHRLGLRLLLLALIAAAPGSAPAQTAPQTAAEEAPLATLVADSLAISGDSQLIAEGNVEVFYNGLRLTASRISYDQKADRLTISGPIRIDDGQGDVILADQAELSADLQEGVLRSARLVLNQQLQLASNEIQRVGGRYTKLGRTVASSCRVCEGSRIPLWEVRAASVVHDQLTQRLYFEDATLRVGGVPIFYIPRLRIPDPSVKRATGFLVPDYVFNSSVGNGVRAPYFIVLGPSRDLTLTPYVTAQDSRTLGVTYRQAFAHANLQFDAALTRDQILPGQLRGYARAIGDAELSAGFALSFTLARVSDDSYLEDYSVSDSDRIDSQVDLSRFLRDEAISANVNKVQTLREGETNATIPSLITDVSYYHRLSFGPLGGEAGISARIFSDERTSTSPYYAPGATISEGRDTRRAAVSFDWQRDWQLPQGVQAGLQATGSLNAFRIDQDILYAGDYTRSFGALAGELRWPLAKSEANGAAQLLEPVMQLVWAPGGTDPVPNEDSTLVEFDEGNLFSLNRFPGLDAVERGTRANLGLTWSRIAPEGWGVTTAVGKVLRVQDEDQFTAGSGLQGVDSNWLVAFQATRGGVISTNRVLFDDAFSLTKLEMLLDGQAAKGSFGAGYFYAVADPAEDRDIDTSEISFEGEYLINASWTANLLGRYDLIADAPSRAGVGLVFKNECIEVNLSLSRRYTSSTNVQPNTDFAVSVDLLGLGGKNEPGPARVCRR